MRLIDADDVIHNLEIIISYCSQIAEANIRNAETLDAIRESYKSDGIRIAIKEIGDNAIEVPESIYETVYSNHSVRSCYSRRCKFCNDSGHCMALDGILDKCPYVRPLPQDREMWNMAKVMCRCYEEDV